MIMKNFQVKVLILLVFLTFLVIILTNTSTATDIPKFDMPLLITCTGQTPGFLTLYTLVNRIGVTADSEPLITPRRMDEPGYKTMIVEMGASLKGLGAAGLNQDEEMERCNAVFAKAKELGVKIIGAHTGGEARRNEIADKFISPFAPQCDYLLVLAEGNKDGFFNKVAEEQEIPLLVFDTFAELPEIFSAMFK